MFQHINEYKRPQYIYKGRNEGFRAVPSIKLPKTKPQEMEPVSQQDPLKEPYVRVTPHTAQHYIRFTNLY